MQTPKLLINGKLVAGDQTIQVINPATQEVLSDVPAPPAISSTQR